MSLEHVLLELLELEVQNMNGSFFLDWAAATVTFCFYIRSTDAKTI